MKGYLTHPGSPMCHFLPSTNPEFRNFHWIVEIAQNHPKPYTLYFCIFLCFFHYVQKCNLYFCMCFVFFQSFTDCTLSLLYFFRSLDMPSKNKTANPSMQPLAPTARGHHSVVPGSSGVAAPRCCALSSRAALLCRSAVTSSNHMVQRCWSEACCAGCQ